MREFLQKALKFLIGVAALLFTVALAASFLFETRKVHWFDRNPFLFLTGAGVFALIHLFVNKKPFLYVFAHEVSHAIAALFTGGKVHSIYVSGSSGATKTDKSNVIVLLFPYVFPFFTAVTLLLYGFLEWAGNTARFVPYFYFITGFTLSHHLFLTGYTLFKEQSDVKKAGPFFALALIAAANVSLLTVLFAFLFDRMSAARCFSRALYIFEGLFK